MGQSCKVSPFDCFWCSLSFREDRWSSTGAVDGFPVNGFPEVGWNSVEPFDGAEEEKWRWKWTWSGCEECDFAVVEIDVFDLNESLDGSVKHGRFFSGVFWEDTQEGVD
uniref:Uncharacterized protein n=1 Tax=Compsopogon caeruleus TaxID=31354 RepID=A0A7S1TJC5_9RHOD|mmetsp:Transcript_7140/g.14686  ORF Transcript_7140/g.14686 Transcript_7140/m.14686 type:complete len:109 (+) Transcript_7140:75-401(+)